MEVYHLLRWLVLALVVVNSVSFIKLHRAILISRFRPCVSQESMFRCGGSSGDGGDAAVPAISFGPDDVKKVKQEIRRLECKISAIEYLWNGGDAADVPEEIQQFVSFYKDDDRPTLRSNLETFEERLFGIEMALLNIQSKAAVESQGWSFTNDTFTLSSDSVLMLRHNYLMRQVISFGDRSRHKGHRTTSARFKWVTLCRST